MAHCVDVIFLDIDGVLLPFGGSCDKYHKKDHPCTIEGCIFPDDNMDALTLLLQRIHNITVGLKNVNYNGNNGNANDNRKMPGSGGSTSTRSTTIEEAKSTIAAQQRIHGNPVLVLSSTWRARSEFIRDILSSFCAYAESSNCNHAIQNSNNVWENHKDSFFDICDPNNHTSRHEEIYGWVNANVGARGKKCMQQLFTKRFTNKKKYIVRSWIALDDEDIVNLEDGRVVDEARQHAVRTKSSMGLTLQDVELGVLLIEKQIRDYHGIS